MSLNHLKKISLGIIFSSITLQIQTAEDKKILALDQSQQNNKSIDPSYLYSYFTNFLEQQCYSKYSLQLNKINDLIQQFNEQKIVTEKIKSLLIMSEFYTNQECNKILSEILKQGVNPNDIFLDQFDFSPLGHAILANNVDAVKILLQHKADHNAICNKLINTTTLLHAIKHCKNKESLQIITLLLEYGADPEACSVVSVMDSYLKKKI